MIMLAVRCSSSLGLDLGFKPLKEL